MESEDTHSSFVSSVLFLVVAGTALFFIRKFFKGGQFTERVSAKEKVAVITGGSAGIGFETIRGLNLYKAKVYMLCRNEKKASDAKIRLVKMGCDVTRIINETCDLANFDSIRECVKSIEEKEEKIDILINNAGIMYYPKFEKTVDGHEMTWQSNYLGHFLLTELLLPLLKKSQNGRIVNVSSELHRYSKPINLDKVDEKSAFGVFEPYNRSKLANVMHARELTKRLRKDGHNVIINSLHPGLVSTELSRHLFVDRTPFRQIAAPFRWFFCKTSRDGAQTSLYLALSKKIEGISGKYFSDCKLASESSVALDDAACAKLYDYSLKQVGLA